MQSMENGKMRFLLDGLFSGEASSIDIHDPTWAHIEMQLNYLTVSSRPKFWQAPKGEGTVRLWIENGANSGVFYFDNVCVHAAENNYLLTHTKFHSENESEVYSLFDAPESNDQSLIWVGVEHFPASMVGQDFSVVLKAFKEFFDMGKIDLRSYGVTEH